MPADRDVEKRYSMPEFIAKLRRLADALETGKQFVIQVAGEKISVPEDATISIEHEREEGREELEFQLSWTIDAQEEVQEEAQDEEEDEEEDAEDASAAAPKGGAPA